MIIQPFGFLASPGGITGFSGTYKNLIRSLGAVEYWGAEKVTALARDEFYNWPGFIQNITHSTSGSPITTSPGYLTRPNAVGTQIHRYNAVGPMGPAFIHGIWVRFPNSPGSSTEDFMNMNVGGSNSTQIFYGSSSTNERWQIQRAGVTKNLSYAGLSSLNTWHYINVYFKNDGSVGLCFDGLLRATDKHAGAFGLGSQQLQIVTTSDWAVDYDAVAVWKGESPTGETSLVNMNRPYWVVQKLVTYDCDAFSLSPTYFFRLDSPSGVETDPIGSATLTFSGSPNRAQTSIIPNTESPCIDWVPSARAVAAGITGWTSSDGFTASLFTVCDSTAETWAYELAAQAPSPAMVMNFGGVSGDITVGLYDGGPTNRSLTFSGVDWGSSSMHHVVHAGTQNVDHKIYVDGVEVVNGVLTAVAGWGQVGTNNHVADNDTGAGNNYDGRMQDFKLYKRELTALEVSLDNAIARGFDNYEFEIAKRTPAMHIRCVDVDEYPTNKFQAIIGPNYGTRSGSVLTNRTGPQFVQDAGHLSADFDGTNDHIALTNPDLESKINGTGNFTISAWAYFDTFGVSFNTGRVIIRNNNSYMLYQYDDGATLTGVQVVLIGITTAVGQRPHWARSNMSTGQWYHFVTTYDSTAGEAKLYADGVLVSNKTGLSGTLANPAGTPTRIGEEGTGAYDFDGSICHVTIDAESTWTLQQVRYSYFIGSGKSKADAYALSLSPDGYWPLDETAGTTANDISGNSFNGTYTSTYTLNQATPLVNSSDPSVLFGDPGYVVGTADFGNNGGTQFTVAGWVRPDSNGTNQYFVSKYSGISGWAAFRVYRASGNNIRFYIEDGTRNPFWEISPPGVFSGAASLHNPWYHFCFVWDRVGATGASTDVTGYLNGYKFPSLNYTSNGYTGVAFTFTEGNTEFRFMSLSANSGTQAEGTGELSKVFIKNAALTDAEVRGLYLSGLELDQIT